MSMENFSIYKTKKGRLVTIGDTILISLNNPDLLLGGVKAVTITKNNVDALVKQGYLVKMKLVVDCENSNNSPQPPFTAPDSISYYIYEWADKIGCSKDSAVRLIKILQKTNPVEALNIILSEVAIAMGVEYGGDQRNWKEAYFISNATGKICRLKKNPLLYPHLILFPTLEMTQRAIEIVGTLYSDLYGEQKD
jgi:hypothetical protein